VRLLCVGVAAAAAVTLIFLFSPELLRAVRMLALLRLVKPYTRVRLAYLAEELRVTAAELEDLLSAAVLTHGLAAHIDQLAGLLLLDPPAAAAAAARCVSGPGGSLSPLTSLERYDPLSRWTGHLVALEKTLLDSIA
jgi:hypothetical protein